MKNIFSAITAFVIEITATPFESNPENQRLLQIQRAQEEQFDFEEYCETQGFFSTLTKYAPEEVAYKQLPEKYIQITAKLISGPDWLGYRSFHYPLIIKTVNMNDPSCGFTAARPFYPDSTAGIVQAENRVLYDLRSQLSQYGIESGYRVEIQVNYNGQTTKNDYGPFTIPFDESSTEVDPDYLVQTLYWGFDGAVLEVVKFINNQNITPKDKEIVRQGLTRFCFQVADLRKTTKFSEPFLQSLIDNAPKIINNQKALESLHSINPNGLSE